MTTKTNSTPKYLIITAMLNISLWIVRLGLAIVWIPLALIIVFPCALITRVGNFAQMKESKKDKVKNKINLSNDSLDQSTDINSSIFREI